MIKHICLEDKSQKTCLTPSQFLRLLKYGQMEQCCQYE